LTENQERWLQALESGEYEQCQGTLINMSAKGASCYCCLGLGCKILGMTPMKTDRGFLGFGGSSTYLTLLAIRELGLRSNDGQFKTPIFERGNQYDSLEALNDNAKWTFKQIAAYIRSNPENVFRDSLSESIV